MFFTSQSHSRSWSSSEFNCHLMSREHASGQKSPDESIYFSIFKPQICTARKMLSARGIRNACPRCNTSSLTVSSRFYSISSPSLRTRRISPFQYPQSNRNAAITQAFSTSRCLRQEGQAAGQASPEEIEQIVRDAKQRFRDTLPKGYLNDEEYAVYERLYGAPLRETRPEDVGIPEHADMGFQAPRPDNEGTLLRQLEGGEFEEITYEIPINRILKNWTRQHQSPTQPTSRLKKLRIRSQTMSI